MIGKIEFPGGEATLEDNGKWTSDDDLTEQGLNISTSPSDEPTILPYGCMSIIKAAKITGGKIVKIPKVVPLKQGEMS